MHGAQHVQLQLAQFAVGDHQKVAAAASRVEKSQRAQLLVELEQFVPVAFHPLELVMQFVEEQWLNELEDVLFAGVVRADVAPRLGIHDALEQRAEDRGRDRAPVQRAAVEQCFTHGEVEIGDGQHFLEQLAVDVGKCGKLLVEIFRALVFRRVEHLKHLRELRAEVCAIGRGALFYPGTERAGGLEDAGVFGEQAEQQAHQQHFERMALVTRRLERIVQPAHALGGLDVDRVLRRDGLRAVTGDEGEMLDALVQVGEFEFGLGVVFEIVETEAREVGDEHIFRQVAFLDAGEIIERLGVGLVQILAARLVFDQQHALPEQVDVALPVAELLDRLLEAGDALAVYAEDVEELHPERFGLGIFRSFVFPAFGEFVGTVADFVPA